MILRECCWAQNEAEYSRLAARGWIPVLRPPDDRRRQRWEEALAYYQVSMSSSPAPRSDRIMESLQQPDDVVACLSRGLRVVAELFARSRGRKLVQVSGLLEMVDFVARERPASITLFAPRGALDGGALECLSNLGVAAGIVTGRDLAAISFLVAKLLAGSPNGLDSRIYINALEDWVSIDPGRAAPPKREGLTIGVRDLLTQRCWRTAAILAHGEGSHLKLGPLVGCGAADVDRHNDGGAIVGCEHDVTCRRQRDLRVIPLCRVKAERVWLHSCWGMAVAGEVYPSDSSVILALAEGTARTIIAPRGLVLANRWSTPVALDVLERGEGFGEATNLLNDLHALEEGYLPFALLGDASGTTWGMSRATDDGTISSDTRQSAASSSGAAMETRRGCGIRYFDLGRWSRVPMVSLERPEGALLVRGRRGGVIIGCDEGPVRLVDRSEIAQAWTTALRSTFIRLRRASLLEQWLVCHFQPTESDTLPAWIDRLTARRIAVEHGASRAASILNVASRGGVWHHAIDNAWRHVRESVRQWGETLASAVDEVLYEGATVHITTDLWADPLSKTYAISDRRCTFCNRHLRQTTLAGYGESNPGFIRNDCLIHELHDFYPAGGRPVGLAIARPLERDKEVEMRVVVPTADARDDLAFHGGWLVGAIHDNGHGKRWFRHRDQLTTGSTELIASLPVGASPDQHVFRFAWISGLDLQLVRTMAPLVVKKNLGLE